MRRFLTDYEYPTYFFELGGVRRAIATDLERKWGPGPRRILDVASGHGLFGLEVTHAFTEASVCLTGLPVDALTYRDVVQSVRARRSPSLSHLEPADAARTRYVVADVTRLPFADGAFDGAVNFLGLEDVHMLGGPEAVAQAIQEAARVTRPNGWIEIAVQVFGDNAEDRLAKQIMASVGHNALFLDLAAYEQTLAAAGVRAIDKKAYSTERLLTASQAREELRYACVETPRVYGRYGVKTNSFEAIWHRFEDDLRRYGYALYTDLVVLVGRPGG